MLDPVTIRYTEALFGLARRSGILEEMRADVARLARELASPSNAAFLFDGRIPVEERRARIQPFLTGVHVFFRNFVNLLFDRRREEVLRNLGEAFHQRALDEEGAAEGLVESARPMSTREVSDLALALGARLGKKVALESRVNPEVLGGVRVVVGSKMLDCSLAGRMDELRRKLLAAPLPSLQEA